MPYFDEYPNIRYNRYRTPYAIICPEHELVYLTHEEYDNQLMKPDHYWICPLDNHRAVWDDENYELMMGEIVEE